MEPIIKEVSINAPIATVWNAVTNKDQMKEWYFDIADFKPEPGHAFEFMAECDGEEYLHICRVKEVVPMQKISYTWRYEQTKGDSLVTFELYDEGEVTRVKLTHEGVELFADHGKDFGRECFDAGWTDFIQRALKEYAEKATV